MGPPLENGHASDSTSTYQPVNNNVEDEALSQTKIKQLESELPPSLTETVPLGLLVDRVAVEVYRDLHTLAETLPTLSDLARKQSIIQWIGHSGRRLLRLAVLARWSNNAPLLKKISNIQGFLQLQNHEIQSGVSLLDEAKQSTLNARLRNYDLQTAIDLLSTGTFQRLPAVLQTWAEAEKATTEETLSTLQELNRVLRYRLAVVEVIPAALRHYTIADGKALFRVPGLFQASLTLGGADPTDRWYLWSASFLVTNSSGLEQEVELAPALKADLVEQCNIVLVDDLPEGMPKRKNQSKPALVRLYEFLENLALNFRLERLHTQALELTRSYGWVGNLTVQQARDRKSLDVSYWVDAKNRKGSRVGPAAAAPIKDAKQQPPRITFALSQTSAGAGTDASLTVLEDSAASVDHVQLTYRWHPETDQLSGLKEAQDVNTLENDVQLEDLLYRLLRRHVDHVMRHMFKQTLASGHFGKAALVPHCVQGSRPAQISSFDVALQRTAAIRIRIPEQSGQFECTPLSGVFTHSRGQRIVRFSKVVNENRALLPDSLHKLRASIVAEDLEQNCATLGLRLQKRLSIKPGDQVRFGSAGRLPFMIHLPNSSQHFLAIVVAEHELLAALVSLKKLDGDLQQSVDEIGWIDTEKLGLPKDNGFELPIGQLQKLHEHCCARVSSYVLEQQLYSRRIPFQHAWGKSSSPAPLSIQFPVLLIRLTDLMPNVAPFTHVLAAAVLTTRAKEQPFAVKFVLRIKTATLKRLSKSLTLPTTATLDPSNGLLTFQGDLQEFLAFLGQCWKQLSPPPPPPPVKTKAP